MHFIYNNACINTSFKKFKVLKVPSSDRLNFICGFSVKVTCAFLLTKKNNVDIRRLVFSTKKKRDYRSSRNFDQLKVSRVQL